MKAHPAADLFPMMSDDELSALAADIREHGLLEPIVLHEGLILDGRNRLKACRQVHVEPRFQDWDGASPTQYVISRNILRRHLTPSQRAALAVEVLPMFRAEAAKRRGRAKEGSSIPEVEFGAAREKAAAAVHAGDTTVKRAMVVKQEDPEAFSKIRAGELKVATAFKNLAGSAGSRGGTRPGDRQRNVDRIRKLADSGKTSRQIAQDIGHTTEYTRQLARAEGILIQADKTVGVSRAIRPVQALEATVGSIGAALAGIDELLDRDSISGIPAGQIGEAIDSLKESARVLSGLIRRLRSVHGHEEG